MPLYEHMMRMFERRYPGTGFGEEFLKRAERSRPPKKSQKTKPDRKTQDDEKTPRKPREKIKP